MSHSQARRELEEDMSRLRRLLEQVATPATASLVEKSEVSILNLACGACDEAATLGDFFASLREGRRPAKVSLTGTDVRERELEQARERFRNTSEREFEFFKSDASKLSSHKQLRERFDVLFMRHQNMYHGRALWSRLFEEGLQRLDDEGVMIITSYFDREHELALEALDHLGVELVATQRNAASRELAYPGKSVDRHVAVLRKKRRP